MKLVVGLGNPGPRYETTRHNAGFLALDRLIDDWSARGPVQRDRGLIWETSQGGEKVLLIKPQTFMNLSGRCVAPIFNFYKCAPTDLIVVYDEIELNSMALRIKAGGGAAGHNGIKSIDQELGAENTGYYRVRIGVGRPEDPRISLADHVLAQFTDEELNELDPLLDRVKGAVELLLRGDMVSAQQRYNRS